MSLDKISLILASNPNAGEWGDLFIKILPIYQISSPIRIVHFLSQICYESSYCTKLEENLNYSSESLLKNYPARFTPDDAQKYGANSQHKADKIMIGNILYANRLGNGNISSNDGYKFRGRGLIQLTGKVNYKKFSIDTYGNEKILDNPDVLTSDKEIAIHSACWFWSNRDLNIDADQDNLASITKKINGGLSSLNARKAIYQDIKLRFGIK